jgi:hypothetical protein
MLPCVGAEGIGMNVSTRVDLLRGALTMVWKKRTNRSRRQCLTLLQRKGKTHG